MQIRITMRYHLTSTGMATIKKMKVSVGEDGKEVEHLCTDSGNCKIVQPLWKTV